MFIRVFFGHSFDIIFLPISVFGSNLTKSLILLDIVEAPPDPCIAASIALFVTPFPYIHPAVLPANPPALDKTFFAGTLKEYP